MDDYIALHTYDYKLSFCQATNDLPGDMQRLVWEKLNAYAVSYTHLTLPTIYSV